MSRSSSKRTLAQNRQLWGLVGELQRSGLSRDDAEAVMRETVRAVSGSTSVSKLTRQQARAAIDRLTKRVSESTTGGTGKKAAGGDTRDRPGRRSRGRATISQRQQDVLQRVFVQAGMATRAQQMAFARRQTGTPWPQTQKDFDAIMEALKAMVLRTTSPMDAWRRVQALLEHPGLDAYERKFIPDLHQQFLSAEKSGTLDKVLTTHKLAKLIEAEQRCGVTP